MKLEIAPLGNIEIFSIGIGEVGKGLQFRVGQKMTIIGKTVTITDIVRDESSYDLFNEITYMIFAETPSGEKKMIKAFVNQPVYISTKI
jgi:hypothetical protein